MRPWPHLASSWSAILLGHTRPLLRGRVRRVLRWIDRHLDDGGTVVTPGVLHGRLEIGQRGHAAAPHAERRRRGREINRAVPDAVVGYATPMLGVVDGAP